MATSVDDTLEDWSAISSGGFPSLLVGNGLSINLWGGFAYDSLLSQANLSAEAQAIFAELATTNFETALECIHHARLVLSAQGRSTSRVDAIYAEVRDALFAAVGSSHVPWSQFPGPTHTAIADEIDSYGSLYVTNYDLCIYWSHLENSANVQIVDYFWGAGHTFDPYDVGLRSTRLTPIHYLHGGIHLWQSDAGESGKWTNADCRLLSLAAKYTASSDRRPLFVSEGTSRDKVRAIRRSEYLSFCLDTLADDDEDLAIFGHSLSSQDQHIIDAVNSGRTREIAVSIRPTGRPKKIIEEKVRIEQALHRHRVTFYDSTTHPLGVPSLRIP